jgi:hypothetical protein
MQQHYLPQFYLKCFCDPDTPPGQEPYVWVYAQDNPIWKKKAPANIAKGADLYSFTDNEGHRHDEIERGLGEVESQAASILRDKISKYEPHLDEREVVTLALFVGYMAVRIPSFHERLGDFMIDVVSAMMRMQASKPEAFPALKASVEEKTGEKLPDWFGPEHLDPSRYIITPSKSLVVALALSPIKDITYHLTNMSWRFLVAEEGFFITSDWPFCMLNPKLIGSFYGPGLAQKDVEVTIPLSPRIALLATWDTPDTRFSGVGADTVSAINKRTALIAREFVVSQKPGFAGDEILKSWEPPDKAAS